MYIHLRTRSRSTDYAFIGEAPTAKWWTTFANYTSFERPTIIVLADGATVRCYLGGIGSITRRDRVGTIIRYSLVLHCDVPTETEDCLAILGLVRACLPTTEEKRDTQLERLLDEYFSDDDVVERLLKSDDAREDCNGHLDRVLKAIKEKLSIHEMTTDGEATTDRWAGDVASCSARLKFLSHVQDFLTGKQKGVAAHLNLVGGVDDLQTITTHHPKGVIAILMDDPDPPLETWSVLRNENLQPKITVATTSTTDQSFSKKKTYTRLTVGVGVLLLAIWLTVRGSSPIPYTSTSQTSSVKR